MTDNDPLSAGARTAVSHWTQVAQSVHDMLAPKIDRRKTAQATDFLETLEAELAPHLAPFLTQALDNPALPPEVRELLEGMIGPTHLGQSLILGVAIGAIISPVLGAATAPFIQTLANNVWPTNPSIPLSPPEIALAMVRNNPYITDHAAEAAMSGIDGHRLQALEYNTGEPPSPQELLLLFRRGQITQARLETGIRQSRIRDEWFPEILELRFAPQPGAAVVAGAVQNHLDLATAEHKWAEAGNNPDDFQWQYDTHGRPPGAQEMLHLLNRGLMTEAQVRQGIRESDIKDKYIDAILETRVYIPPVRSVIPMLRSGSITETRARELLAQQGVQPADQDAYIAEATTHTASSTKELGASQVVRAYEERLIDQPTAIARLEALKYNTADATTLIQLADNAITERFRNGAITRVHSLYVNHKITRAQAATDLGAYGLPAPATTTLLTLWDDERAANVAVLSVAQCQGALHRTVFTLDEFITRMHAHGYSGIDVKVLAA